MIDTFCGKSSLNSVSGVTQKFNSLRLAAISIYSIPIGGGRNDRMACSLTHKAQRRCNAGTEGPGAPLVLIYRCGI